MATLSTTRNPRSTRVAAAAAVSALLCLPTVAHAGGFGLNENGAAATGMAGAFTAKADDPSAIFFNPAGLAHQRHLQVYFGGTLILSRPVAEGTPSYPIPRQEANFIAQPIGELYLAYGLPHDFAIGIGVFANFGLKIDWPDDSPGRFAGTYVSLQTVTINPTIAWRPVRWLAIGVGLDLIPASVDLQRVLNLVDAEALLRFRANDLGVGGNVGVLFQGPILRHRLKPLFSLGVTYRSGFNLDFDGAFQPSSPREFSQVLRDAPATARLRMPDQVSVGVGVRPIDRLFLQVQFDWVHWSRIQELSLTVRDNPLSLVLPEEWRSGYTLRFGGEIELGRWRPRLGVGYDWSPVPTKTLGPIVPDSNRVLVTGGLGVLDLPAHLALELSLMGIIFNTVTSQLPEFPAKYSNWAVLIGGAISYRGNRPTKPKAQVQPQPAVYRPEPAPPVTPPPEPLPVN